MGLIDRFSKKKEPTSMQDHLGLPGAHSPGDDGESESSESMSSTAGANGDTPPIEFKHSEIETGGSKYPKKVLLHAHHADTGDKLGTLSYYPPKKAGGQMAVDFLNVHPKHQRKGVGSALMDEMQRRHPNSTINHGNRTDQGKAWWQGYTDGKSVNNGRTASEREWTPEGKYWGANSEENDQRLFDGDHLKPALREDLLKRYAEFCHERGYNGWVHWTRIYFAGSEAAKWAPFNGDFDILVGIDYPKFRQWNPQYFNDSDEVISKAVTAAMREDLNNETYQPPGIEATLDNTWYVNPNSYDIRAIHPYAAYEVISDKWAVKPLEVPDDWSAKSIPESFWEVSEAEANLIFAISAMPSVERQRVASQVWDMIHEGRKSAFSEGGKSIFDFNNIVEKYLDQRPDHPLALLISMKNETPDADEKDAWKPPQPDLGDFTAAMKEEDKGVMIAFVPPIEVREQLYHDRHSPQDVADMHVTVAYLGGLEELTPKQRRHLPDLVQNWAVAQHPLRANVSGVGTFANPDSHVLVALPDIPHAGKMRESLVDYLEAHGYGIYHNHGWTPHITLGYSKHHWRFIPKTEHVSWPIDGISVFIGGRETHIPFGTRKG